jgi:threonine/homoserine/homoserine lactone efflux protein
MPDAKTLVLFMTATLALNITPGLDMLYVIGRTVSDGRRGGVVSAFGISGGIAIHIILLATGLGALVMTKPIAYDVVRGAGALYLGWLGIQGLRRTDAEIVQRSLSAASPRVVFGQGVLTSLLNPKVALFFLAFLPQFVDPSGPIVRQFILLGTMFVISGTTVNLAVVFAVHLVRRRLLGSRRAQLFLSRGTGVLFLGLALQLALSGR